MKIVVCVLGQIRCADLTWPHFKRNVLDELGADLITCGPDSDTDSPFTRAAQKNIYSESRVVPGRINAQIVLDHRNVLGNNIDPTQWDQIILTRSDHMWYGPHPKLDLEHFWFMNSEFHFGISDRHTVVNSECFKILMEIGSIPFGGAKNIEEFLFNRMIELGQWGNRVGLSHFPMYLTDENGNYRLPDENDAANVTITWPFIILHNKVSRSGMCTGMAVSL